MFLKSFLRGALDNRIFNLPLQYRITKNRSRLLRTEPPAYLLRPGVHLFQRHLRRTITKSVYIAIISRLVGYFLNNYAFHILVLIMYSKFAISPLVEIRPVITKRVTFRFRAIRPTLTPDVIYCNPFRIISRLSLFSQLGGATRRLPIDPLPGRFPYEHPHTPRIGDNNKSFHNQRRKLQYYFCTRSERGNTGKFDRSIFPVVPLSIVYP